MRVITSNEKRLIALMQKGCLIYVADGHRWLYQSEAVDYTLHDVLRKNSISLNSKCYGGIDELLNNIDKCLVMCNDETLEQYFDNHINAKYDVEHISDNSENRISKNTKCEGID